MRYQTQEEMEVEEEKESLTEKIDFRKIKPKYIIIIVIILLLWYWLMRQSLPNVNKTDYYFMGALIIGIIIILIFRDSSNSSSLRTVEEVEFIAYKTVLQITSSRSRYDHFIRKGKIVLGERELVRSRINKLPQYWEITVLVYEPQSKKPREYYMKIGPYKTDLEVERIVEDDILRPGAKKASEEEKRYVEKVVLEDFTEGEKPE